MYTPLFKHDSAHPSCDTRRHHGASRLVIDCKPNPAKPDELCPNFVGMRGQKSHDYGMQVHECSATSGQVRKSNFPPSLHCVPWFAVNFLSNHNPTKLVLIFIRVTKIQSTSTDSQRWNAFSTLAQFGLERTIGYCTSCGMHAGPRDCAESHGFGGILLNAHDDNESQRKHLPPMKCISPDAKRMDIINLSFSAIRGQWAI